MAAGSKTFPSGSLSVIVSGTIIPFSTPWFQDPWILMMGETIQWPGHWFKAYTAFWRTLPQPSRLLPPNWHCNCIFKMLFCLSFRSATLGCWEHAKASGCPNWSLAHCGTSLAMKWVAWSEADIVWNTVTVDKALYNATDGGFCRNIKCRKGKSITGISFYARKDKVLFFLGRKWSEVVNLPLGHWLVTPGSGAISGSQCWSLLLANLALRNSSSHVSLDEWKFILFSSWIISISATMTILFIGPLSNGTDGWGKALTIHKWAILSTELLNPFSANIIFTRIFHILYPFGEIYLHSSSLGVFLTNFPVMLPSSWSCSQFISYSLWISKINK